MGSRVVRLTFALILSGIQEQRMHRTINPFIFIVLTLSTGGSHMALIRGDISDSSEPVLVRMHAHCLLGDVFGATGCDCHQTLEASLQMIAADDAGDAVYLHQTSKGFSAEKIGEQSFLT